MDDEPKNTEGVTVDIVNGEIVEVDESKPDYSKGEVIAFQDFVDRKVEKLSKAVASTWVYDCPKKGHSFDVSQGAMMAEIGAPPTIYAVRICVACGCPVYTTISKRVSPILDSGGSSIITEN